MKNFKKYLVLPIMALGIVSCSSDDDNFEASSSVPTENDVTLEFNNTFKGTTIVLDNGSSSTYTSNTSEAGQEHHFSELKYVISNIRLINLDGTEVAYNTDNLDTGATIVDQSDEATLQYVLNNIPTDKYSQIKFGLGVETALNTLDQVSFPDFYAAAGENDTEMHWEWGTGYRFTKIEGFYGADNSELSIHTGSTVEGVDGDESTYTQGVDAYREITLTLTEEANVGTNSPTITIEADFDALLSGTSNTITLGAGNATPSIHTAVEMEKFVNNIGGNGDTDTIGMFSIQNVEN
ncbi:MbnP family protein [Bizionia sp. KMM 8389]